MEFKSMGYSVEVISPKEKELLMGRIYSQELYERKAIIHGTCVKLFTDDHDFKDKWEDNFEMIPDWFRPHARLFCVKSKGKLRVRYEPISKTVIIENCEYYGWVKSIALALVADFLEDATSEHRRYSVHGSFIDLAGRGIALIGPSGSGKTTLTYGLLLDKKCNFLTDDWFFVRLADGGTLVYSSEKNSYIRGDLSSVWPQYKLKNMEKDSMDRAVVDVKRLLGIDRIRTDSTLSATVLLTRQPGLPPLTKLNPKDALAFMEKNDFCNPHQLIRTRSKKEKREKFFLELFGRAPVHLLNTIETPKESLARLKGLVAP
jgi:hypothetical protein